MRLLFFAAIILLAQTIQAQSILNKIKNKAQEKVENMGSKSKKTETSESEESESTSPAEETEQTENKSAAKPADSDVGAYRKFGFVRGSNIIFQDAFEDDEIGDYPKRWNSDGGGEVVKLTKFGGNWLRGTETANHFLDYLKTLPLNFTLEFDVISDAKSGGDYNELTLMLASTKGGRSFNSILHSSDNSNFKIDFDLFKPWLTYENNWLFAQSDTSNSTFLSIISPTQFDLKPFNFNTTPLHVSIVRQDQRLVLYLNTTRIFDIRNAFAKSTELNNIMFTTYSKLEDQTSGLYFSNLILAETVMDIRKDMFIDGKFVTNAILFETNSDKIQLSSLSAVGVIAEYMKNNPAVKLKVVGHTDDVGNDEANQSLSERRARSVVKELVEYHKIDAARLSSEGRGESQPIADNTTKEGKAQNRRVEFIKQ